MRKTIIFLLTCTVLLLIGYAALRGYQVWKRDHMMSLAREFAAKKDVRNAVLSLNQVLRSNPKHLDATRLMAELAEASGLREAFLWRSRAVDAAPDSTDDRLALARVALGLRDLTSASNALDGIRVDAKNTAAYHNIAGTLAVASGQIPSAESHFTEASRLNPTNPAPRLNLAVLALAKTNATAVANARATLEQLGADPAVGCQALRELVQHSIRTRRTNDALAFATRLVQQTQSTFADQLLHLDVLRRANDPQSNPHLALLQRDSLHDRGRVQQIAAWMMSRLGPADALTWMDSLPPDTRTNQPVSMLAADCLVLLKNWPELQAQLQKQSWADLDFLRRAFLSRALRGQDLASSAKTEWELALKAANRGKPQLIMLLRIAAQWSWPNEAEQILWTFCSHFPSEKWAPATLAQLLHSLGRTDALMQLYSQLHKANPNDLAAKNNLAMLALLLDAQQLKPHNLARELYEKSPTNATFTSTYAFSLYRQNKPADAVQLLEHLKAEELENPSIAAYYGVLLRATGNGKKAKKYFDLATKATLLPEERRLIEQAQRL